MIKRYCREESNAENINKNYGALVGWEIVGGQRRSIRGAKDYENKRKAANKFFEELIKGSVLLIGRKKDFSTTSKTMSCSLSKGTLEMV